MDIDPKLLATDGFDWKKAYALCEAAKLAYSQPAHVRQTLNDVWKMRSRVFSEGETQGFVGVNDDVVVVCFRGTQGLGDWGDNFRALPAAFPPLNGDVHSGFLGAWGRAAPIVDQVLRNAAGKKVWFTGHSLGGAVALLAAATYADTNPAGLVTFGQPRLLGRRSARALTELYGARYVRVVNSNDIVPKIPPFYRHTGQLFHFDRFGDLPEESFLSEGEIGEGMAQSDGPEPMSEAEYNAMLEQINRLEDEETTRLLEGGGLELEGEAGPTLVPVDDLNAAIEGNIIGVSAHRIDRYVSVTRRQAFPPEMPDMRDAVSNLQLRAQPRMGGAPVFADLDFSEESPFEMAMESAEEDFVETPKTGSVPTPPKPRQPILIRLKTSGKWSPPEGLEIGSRIERIVTAFATAGDLAALADNPKVASVEVSREAGMIELEHSMDYVGGTVAHAPPISERGDAALVGIVDTGVDILHEAFRDASGSNTRIVAIWDQRGSGGPTPRSVNPDAFSQNYGRVYVADEIDRFIADHASGAPTHPPRLRDAERLGRGGHGTHVAGIAAGRAVGGLPYGMAPEAGIVVVMSALSQAAGNPTSIGYSVSHVDAIQFLKGVSEGSLPSSPEPKPIAINVSQGMNAGAHDGSTLLEAAFDMLTGIGRDEGCVIVKSAGNERSHAGHASKKLFAAVDLIEWESSATDRQTDYFEGWFETRDDVAFRVIDPLGRATDEVSFDMPEIASVMGGNLVELRLTKGHRDNGDHRLTITISKGFNGSTDPIQPGRWALELIGRSIASERQEFHIWAERSRTRATKFVVEDEEMTLSIPGTAETVLCVGACNSQTPPRMNRSSSQGLTRKGDFKPDLSAPGFEIVAAKSGQPNLDAMVSKSGTSMAAPHVAGALALVMSKRAKEGAPQLNARQLKSALIATVRPLATRHHPVAGYGILDVEELIKHFDEG